MEAYRESSATAPFILNLSGVQHHASGALNLGKTQHQWLGSWVDTRAGLEILHNKKKSLTPAWTQTLDCPARSLVAILTTLSQLPKYKFNRTRIHSHTDRII